MEEILNIQFNVRELVIKALNKYPTKKAAAVALGITERHLYNLIYEFNLQENEGAYSYKSKLNVLCFVEI